MYTPLVCLYALPYQEWEYKPMRGSSLSHPLRGHPLKSGYKGSTIRRSGVGSISYLLPYMVMA
jgi:hypothetical protein